jgi:hypothetical protein
MKCLALAAIIIFGVAQQPAKAPNKGTTKNSRPKVADQANTGSDKPTAQAAQAPDKTVTPVQNQTDAASHADQKTTNEELKVEELQVQKTLARFTGYLVVVGFLQLIVLAGQALLFFRQATIMGQHRTSLEDLARAARDNATAASLNAQAVISSERPWVSIFVKTSTQNQTFDFKAANLGRTPAEIVSYSYLATFLDRLDNFPTPPQYGVEHVPPVKLLVPSGGDPDGQTLDLMFYDAANILKNDAQRAKAMSEGREVFLFYFRIIYKHVLGNTHPSIPNYETRMSFWYTPATRELHIGGPDEYNRHT